MQEQQGDLEEALAALERAVSLAPLSPRMHGALGRTLALRNRRDAATRTLRQLETLARERYVSPFEFASVYLALGQSDVAFKWLIKARDERVFELIAMRVDSRFDPAAERSPVRRHHGAHRLRLSPPRVQNVLGCWWSLAATASLRSDEALSIGT